VTLGIVDWGIGGLGLLGLLDERAPHLPVVYWSDAGTQPYGLQPSAQLASRLRVVVGGLAARGCTEVVLACNAASTVLGRLGVTPVPVEGIITHGIAAAALAVPEAGVIGVVGGARTIHGGQYRRALTTARRSVRSRVAQPLSAHIEAGRVGTAAFEADLARIVRPLRPVDALVLACTHYPAASAEFADALPGVRLVDPAEHLADSIVARHPRQRGSGKGDRHVITTGNVAQMRAAAGKAWGMDLAKIERVRV
jgi:glutamate racemase